MSHRQQVFELQAEEIVPAITFHEVVLIGIVAAGAFMMN
jgi:hypothetical protein